jgi:ATP-dependent helicase/nuclease subunit B
MAIAEQLITFALVPDSGAARRLRRAIALEGACGGVVVGTWRELLERARHAYLLMEPADEWGSRLRTALAAQVDAFWAKSFEVAPDETTTALGSSYVALLQALASPRLQALPADSALRGRAQRRYTDLAHLSATLDGALPSDLATLNELLSSCAAQATHKICVIHVNEYPALSRWQTALVEKLNADAVPSPSTTLRVLLAAIAATDSTKRSPSALAHVQAKVFEPVTNRVQPDETLQWVGCRDFLEETEVAAGMVQQLLKQDATLKPSEVGILIPDDFEYALALADTFALAGLSASGLNLEQWRRDLGRELVLLFLYCRQKPAPAMAMAACLSSPLMPWTRALGAELAQKVMDGDYRLWPPKAADRATTRMLELIREGDESPATLVTALQTLAELMRADDEFADHLNIANTVITELCAALAASRRVDWRELRRRVTPKFLPSDQATEFTIEGVTLWRETLEPWRRVRHLIVLGYSQGHYPASLGAASVFAEDEVHALNQALDIALACRADVLDGRRARFKRQLAGATDSISFCVPRRKPLGDALKLCESHVFIADLLGQADEAERLVLDLESNEDRARLRHVAIVEAVAPLPPRGLVDADLEFNTNLLALRVDEQGKPKPESPSSLETLMVSPLAWLLRRVQAEPLAWAPESVTPMLLGQIAHGVFEELFKPATPLPERVTLRDAVVDLLDVKISEYAPFMRAPQWQVERHNLIGSTERAARGWLAIIEALNAEVLAGEVWLQGHFDDIAVHGQADLVLAIGDSKLLVVDYKRSSSAERRKRMQLTFDSQASLYRTMIETGGTKDSDDEALQARLRKPQDIGIVYYLMNDQTALADRQLAAMATVPGWEVPGDEVSSAAIALIRRRLDQVARGKVHLNRSEDKAFFEKSAALKPYAFDNSPLLLMFMPKGLSEGLQ